MEKNSHLRWKIPQKVFTLLALYLICFMPAALAAQQITVRIESGTLDQAFQQIMKVSDVEIVYNTDQAAAIHCEAATFTNREVSDVLAVLLEGTSLQFRLENGIYLITTKPAAPQQEEIKITGKVVDENKMPLPGVTIQLKGTTVGTVTDAEGHYELVLPAGERITLVYSCVGMESREIVYRSQETIDVVMQAVAEELDEVNVVSTGYGDIDRRRLTAAVTPIKMEDILVPGLSSVDQMLEGYVPGMIFMQNSGQVGATARVRIRGTSTIIGNQEPLWVVDGIIQQDPVNVDPSQLNDLDFVNLLGNAISGLNPDDVERIDVLKDAAATAIYGTRAANGVIVITTKKGKIGPPRVSYSLSGTFTRRPRYSDKEVNVMNSRERVDVSRELFERQMGFKNVITWNGYEKAVLDYKSGAISYDEFKRQVDYFERVNTDWFDILCKDVFSSKHTLSLSGGSPEIRYYASLGFNDQRGVIRGEKDNQFSSVLKLNGAFKRLQFQLSSQVSHSSRKYTPDVNGQSIVLSNEPQQVIAGTPAIDIRQTDSARAHVAKLEVERDSLLSPYVLGKTAEQLGMSMADPGQIRRIKAGRNQ